VWLSATKCCSSGRIPAASRPVVDRASVLLYLPPVEEGKPEISEKGLRKVCAEVDWRKQRVLGGYAD
jgi:hypothetical protein